MFYGESLSQGPELGAFGMRSANRPSVNRRVSRPVFSPDAGSNNGSALRVPSGFVSRRSWRSGLSGYEPELGKFKMKKITKSVAKVAKKAAKVAVKPVAVVSTSALQAAGLRNLAAKQGKALGLTQAEMKLTKYGGTAMQAAALTAAAVAAAPYAATAAASVGKGALVAGKFAASKGALVKTLLPKALQTAKGASSGGDGESTEEASSSSASEVSPSAAPERFDSAYASSLPGNSGALPSGESSSGGSGGRYSLPEQEAAGPAETSEEPKSGISKWLLPAAGAALLIL